MHNWDVSAPEARAIQKRIADQVERSNRFGALRWVAGVDVGFENANTVTRAAVAVLDLEDLTLQESAIAREATRFPYVPGLLSFREAPAILEAIAQLSQKPDIILCDGQGIAHPRYCGIACHLGVLEDIPTLGVGKSRLVGRYREPGQNKGDWAPLEYRDATVGAVLRTRPNVKPLYISTGHRIDLESAIQVVLQCTTKYRLPETTRWAHRLASGD